MNDSAIFAPYEISPQIRQYSSDLIVVAPRYSQYLKEDLAEIYEFTYSGNIPPLDFLEENLRHYNIRLVLVASDQVAVIDYYDTFSTSYQINEKYVAMRINAINN